MQSNSDKCPKFPGKKGKCSSIVPEKLPMYVVAFALKETFDDLVTAQQAICNKRSPQASTNSITPTNSLKLIDSRQTVKLEQISDSTESNNKVVEENRAIDEINPTTLESNNSESNIEDTDQNKIIRFIETDETTDSSNDENVDNIKNADTVEKVDNVENAQSVENVNNIENSDNIVNGDTVENVDNLKSDQPEIIFNAPNYTRRCKDSKFLKRKSKIHKIITPKYNKFKCKTSKNSMSSHLEKYYEKSKQNSINSDHIRDGFSNISTVVSRTRVLKNGLAKENLLDETELVNLVSISNERLNQFNENDDGSQSSYPSTTKNDSFISNSSGKTSTYGSSENASKNEDLYSIGTVKSAIEMSSDNTPYKTDVINVSVAVTYEKSKSITSYENIPNNEKFMHLAALTSQSEPLTMKLGKLTSELPSDVESVHTLKAVSSRKKTTHAKEISNVTIVNKSSSFDVSSDDTFDMARTSSDFNASTTSTSTYKKEMEHELNNEKKELEADIRPCERQQSILDKVINLGYYPEVTPSTSSGIAVTVADKKDFFITGTNQNYHVCSKNKGDHYNESKINLNILKKHFNERDISPTKKPVDLPNIDEIKEMLIDDFQQMKHPEESKYPFNIPEMWDKLIAMLDVAFKRLETAITEKIVKELKNSIASLELPAHLIPEVDMDLERGDIVVIEPQTQEVISTPEFQETDISLQCNLVQSEVIDKIMQTFSIQGPKIIEPGKSVKSLQKLKSKLIRDYLEVLKPPLVVGPQVLEDIGDTVTISTVRTETFNRVHRLRMMFFRPIDFVRENLFVIVSVPAFFVILMFVYGILMLLIKPL